MTFVVFTLKRKESVSWSSMSLREIYQEVQCLTTDEILSLLEDYLDRDTVIALRDSNFVDLWEFTAFFLWLVNSKGYKVHGIGLVHDPETEEPLFLAVYTDCGGADWREVCRSVKKYMNDQGFRDLAGQVALICSGSP